MILLKIGEKQRHFRQTLANKKSSRSHTMFRIYIETKKEFNNRTESRTSVINLVDLAGSENIDMLKSRKNSKSPPSKALVVG